MQAESKISSFLCHPDNVIIYQTDINSVFSLRIVFIPVSNSYVHYWLHKYEGYAPGVRLIFAPHTHLTGKAPIVLCEKDQYEKDMGGLMTPEEFLYVGQCYKEASISLTKDVSQRFTPLLRASLDPYLPKELQSITIDYLFFPSTLLEECRPSGFIA